MINRRNLYIVRVMTGCALFGALLVGALSTLAAPFSVHDLLPGDARLWGAALGLTAGLIGKHVWVG